MLSLLLALGVADGSTDEPTAAPLEDTASTVNRRDLRVGCEGHARRFTAQRRQRVQLALHILRLNNIQPLPCCGTLLGMVRHGTLAAPWDDDLDFVTRDWEMRRILGQKGGGKRGGTARCV